MKFDISFKKARMWLIYVQFSQSLSRVRLFATQWTAACQASRSITNSQSLTKLISIELVMPSNHLILSPSPLPAFSLSQHLFQWVCSSHQVAKVVELQLQHQSFQWIFRDWLSLGLTGLISLQSKGLSRVFSNTTVQKHQYFGTQSIFTSIHDYWKNHSFD